MQLFLRSCLVVVLTSPVVHPLSAKPEPPCRPLLSCAATGGGAVCEVQVAEPRLCKVRTEVELRWFLTSVGDDDVIKRIPISSDAAIVGRGETVWFGFGRPLGRDGDYFVEAATVDAHSGRLLGVASIHLIQKDGGHVAARNHPATERPAHNSREVTWRRER